LGSREGKISILSSRRASASHEYLLDIVSYHEQQVTANQTAPLLFFNHPTSELIFHFVSEAAIRAGDRFNYSALNGKWSTQAGEEQMNNACDPLQSACLFFNGYKRFEEMGPEMFREIYPALYHTAVPQKSIYVYSFALLFARAQQAAADSRGSIGITNERDAVVPSSRHRSRAHVVVSVWYGDDSPHLGVFNTEQAIRVKTVKIQKWTRPSVPETGDCFKALTSCCLIQSDSSESGSLSTGSLGGRLLFEVSKLNRRGLNVQSGLHKF